MQAVINNSNDKDEQSLLTITSLYNIHQITNDNIHTISNQSYSQRDKTTSITSVNKQQITTASTLAHCVRAPEMHTTSTISDDPTKQHQQLQMNSTVQNHHSVNQSLQHCNLTLFFQLKDPILHKEFFQFQRDQLFFHSSPQYTIKATLLIQLCICLPLFGYHIVSTVLDINNDRPIASLSLTAIAFCILLNLLRTGWNILATPLPQPVIQTTPQLSPTGSCYDTLLTYWYSLMSSLDTSKESDFIIQFQIFVILFLVLLFPHCFGLLFKPMNVPYMPLQPPKVDEIILIFANTLYTVPYYLSSILCNISLQVLAVLYTLSTLLIISFIFYLQCFHTIPWIALIIILSVCLIVDRQLQAINAFLFQRHNKSNLRMEALRNSQELRHMMANVAHDLKTPLTSLVTGIECLQDIVNEILSAQSSESPTSHREAIQQSIDNIRNIHTFMLMTINRTQDYTKASTGMKLVPHNETLNWMETLQLPLDCMRNIQSRIPIGVSPELPEDLCPYIITDKQWLQENVLCLLSNAVKYSSGGQITIHVSLLVEQDIITSIPGYHHYHSGSIRSQSSIMSDGPLHTHTPSLTTLQAPSLDFTWDAMSYRQSRKVSPVSELQVSPSSKSFVCIEIEDSGIGMSEEAMANLFSPFQQNQRLAGGTGLGLYSLSKRLDALGGYYGVKKRDDGKQGSVFWFAIPYKSDSVYAEHAMRDDETLFTKLRDCITHSPHTVTVDDDTTHINGNQPCSIAAREVTRASGSDTLRILLVDDSPAIIKMTTFMLHNKLGHQVTTLENGAMLVESIRNLLNSPHNESHWYDLILVDLQMPIMDGLEAITRIRAMESVCPDTHSALKIVGMSANSDEETIQHTLKVGANAFLPKPFTASALNELMENLL